MIPYRVTSAFEEVYTAVDDDLATALDDGLDTLLWGLHAKAAGRRHRVTGAEGSAYVIELPVDMGVWHGYWDYGAPDRDEIHLIALVLIEH